jgi:predicted metal-binding membrane protein
MAEPGIQGALVTRRLPRWDRAIVLAGLVATAALAWAYLLYMGWGMEHMDAGVATAIMPRMTDWGVVDLLLVLAMWVIMMAAMMLPSIVPMVLTFASLSRKRRAQQAPYLRTGAFVLGYLVIWSGFSVLATLAQWGLLEARLVTPMMVSATPLLAGSLLVIAGVFQLTPLKHACLSKCASPLGFLLTEWRDGTRGAWIMGLRHGAYCVGCCWPLMALLFVFGVMNVLWIAALSIYIMLEKLLPPARWLPFAQGLVLVGWGIAVATAV